MARAKTTDGSTRVKRALAERLVALRLELYGNRGEPRLAPELGIPARTWMNYERGVTIPGETILKFIEITSAVPSWLLHGEGPTLRQKEIDRYEPAPARRSVVRDLVKTALQLLESSESTGPKRCESPDG